MTVNAGAIPVSHWTQDPEVGGGRVIGEACHFIDLPRHLAGAPIESGQRQMMARWRTTFGVSGAARDAGLVLSFPAVSEVMI